MRRINLLPESIKQGETVKAIWRSAIILLGTTAVVLLLLHLILVTRVRQLEQLAIRPSNFHETAESSQLRKQTAQIQAHIKRIVHEDAFALKTSVSHVTAIDLLKMIGEVASNKVWFDVLSLDTDGKVFQIQGHSFSTRLVSEFMLELKRLPHFSSVELTSMGKGQSDDDILFKIVCHLK